MRQAQAAAEKRASGRAIPCSARHAPTTTTGSPVNVSLKSDGCTSLIQQLDADFGCLHACKQVWCTRTELTACVLAMAFVRESSGRTMPRAFSFTRVFLFLIGRELLV